MTIRTDFIHLTDLHVSHPDLNDPGLMTDTTGTLRTVVEMIGALDPAPAFVVVSGDLTNKGEPESYELVKATMAALDMPVVYALGNHDRRGAFNSVMLGEPERGEAAYFHDRVLSGIHVVTLDSGIPGRISGTITDEQFDFLEGALARHGDLPKLLVIHHPPSLEDAQTLGWESLDVDSSRRLAATIGGRDVVGILSGHIHFDRVIHWHGVPVVVGTGMHNAIDILFRDGLRILEGAGFALCSLRPSGLTAGFVPLPRSRRELAVYSREKLAGFSARA